MKEFEYKTWNFILFNSQFIVFINPQLIILDVME